MYEAFFPQLDPRQLSAEQMFRGYETGFGLANAAGDSQRALSGYWSGLTRYLNDFMEPFWISLDAFNRTEQHKITQVPLHESLRDYSELLQFNMQVAEKGAQASIEAMREFHADHAKRAFDAWGACFAHGSPAPFLRFLEREARLMQAVTWDYPHVIREIKPEYGFHFENPGFEKVDETDRFLLYRVLPSEKDVQTRQDGKPVLIVHPYVLGPNILCFLPGENKSFVHAWANQGVPTYVRIIKDIATSPGVQTMSGEDDTRDTKRFCERLFKEHGWKVTLNGFCQGGFTMVCELLSGELDGLVDTFITCVSPLDGSRSKSLVEYLQHLPPRFRDLGYAVKTLPNGNGVVDGKVMSWVYKLKSMEREAPVFTFYRDMKMFDKPEGSEVKISKTAAALNHWLIYDRNDLPEAITQMSFRSYTVPTDKDGTLPVTLFGRKLNYKRLAEKGVKVLLCYAEKDDLVDKETALAPTDYIEVEVTEFPKGHGAIATSWSDPQTACALHKRFGNYRGPVRFHLDLEQEARKTAAKKR